MRNNLYNSNLIAENNRKNRIATVWKQCFKKYRLGEGISENIFHKFTFQKVTREYKKKSGWTKTFRVIIQPLLYDMYEF